MISKLSLISSLFTLAALNTGCQSANRHQADVSIQDHHFTMGLVQKEIHVGMSQADVIVVLGSPNIVTNDKSDKETWVYDKIASNVAYSADSGGIWFIAGYQKKAGAVSTTQRTLTIVIKFDANRQVDSVAYHSSKF